MMIIKSLNFILIVLVCLNKTSQSPSSWSWGSQSSISIGTFSASDASSIQTVKASIKQITVPFTHPLIPAPRNVAIGLTNTQVTAGRNRRIQFSIKTTVNLGTQGSSSFNALLQITSPYTISARFLAISSSFSHQLFTYIYEFPQSYALAPFDLKNSVNFKEQTGVTLTKEFTIIQFINSFKLKSPLNIYQLVLNAEIVSETQFQVRLSCSDDKMSLYSNPLISFVIFKKAELQTNPKFQIFSGIITSSNPTNSIQILTQNQIVQKAFMMGWNSFSFKQGRVYFSTNFKQKGTVNANQGNTYQLLSFKYILLNYKVCPDNQPYYLPTDDKCYDNCPTRQYPNIENICQLCHYSCLSCENNLNCLECDQQDHRILNEQKNCVPVYGYFDNGVKEAVLCSSVLDACDSCSSWLECQVCKEGFYVGSDKKCKACSSIDSQCAKCSSEGKCLQCSQHYVISLQNTCIPNCKQIQKCNQCFVQEGILNCKTCQVQYFLTNPFTCATCEDGKYFIQGQCKLCSDRMLDCNKCNFNNNMFKCTDSNLKKALIDYLNENFHSSNPNTVNALIQLAKSLAMVQKASTKQESINVALKIQRAAKCLIYIQSNGQSLAEAISQLYKIMIDSQQLAKSYLNIIQASSGYLNNPNYIENLPSICNQIQAETPKPIYQQTCGSQQKSQVLILVHPFGMGPYVNQIYISETLKKLSSTPDASFKQNYVYYTTPQISDYNKGYLYSYSTDYYELIKNLEGNVITQGDLLSWTLLIVDPDVFSLLTPQQQRKQQFVKYFLYFQERLTKDMSQFLLFKSFALNKLIIQKVSKKRKIILVSESSSSIYVNKIYKQMPDKYKKNIATFYIAPFTSSIADDSVGSYISNPNDLVLQHITQYALEKNYPQPLPDNVIEKVFNNQNFEFNHDYLGYLQAYQSQFLQQIINSKNRAIIFYNENLFKDGNIQCTIMWNKQTYIDLHITEPDNKVVHYNQNIGNYGTIDYGNAIIEANQYYTKCEGEGSGEFSFKIHGYSNSIPTPVFIFWKAGSDFFYKIVTVKPNEYLFIGKVTVTKKSQGTGFLYDVQI